LTPPLRAWLGLNVLLSFAQFEREVTSERIRDKIAALALSDFCHLSSS
jgi:DNA invertase Pin-like site-specific DNA recombinase